MTETAVREITGIERLRALGREQEERSWSMVGKVRGRLMLQIADQIERELTEALDGRGEEVTDVATVRADAMEAYGWARERGGLDAVRRALQDAENRRAELCSALGVDAETGWSDAMEEVRTRVKRSGPKVLDADGVEIRRGDTVYLLPGDWCDRFPCLGYHEWDEMEVLSLSPGHEVGRIQCKASGNAFCYPLPSQLTHRAPVLAADGRPLEDGQTVWDVDGHGPLVVRALPSEGEQLVVLDNGGTNFYRYPEWLTHERPDSWERLEEDARNIRTAILDSDKLPFEVIDERALDLVRRAKTLAGVSE